MISKRWSHKIDLLRSAGRFTPEDAEARCMHLAQGEGGVQNEGLFIRLYVLVDPSDGLIVDAKYQLIGPPLLIALAEGTCEFVVQKNYDQAKRVTLDLITKNDELPQEATLFFPLIKHALEEVAINCQEIALPKTYISPIHHDEGSDTPLPPWDKMSHEERLALIEKVLDDEIRPYVAMDAGGIKVLELLATDELIIAYEGSCTSCFSSVGATLASIQEILRAKVLPTLTVVPNMDNFTF